MLETNNSSEQIQQNMYRFHIFKIPENVCGQNLGTIKKMKKVGVLIPELEKTITR